MKQGSKETIPPNLSSRFADLSPAKRTLLQQKVEHKGLDLYVNQTIPHRKKSEPAPLSFAQQRLWFLDQYEPNNSVYNVSSAMRLEGRLDTDALKRSLDEIVWRHEALRTTFANLNGEPLQVIAPALNRSLTVIDLKDRPESEREDQALRIAGREARRSFDLKQGPLFRATCIRLSEADHILVLVIHHIVSDGWSMAVLYRELSVLYQTFSHSQPSPLAELSIQYADYALWQRQWLQDDVLASQVSYWKKQLEGAPGILQLPTDYPRPAVQSYRGARQSIELSRELTKGITALSREEGVTVFMTLLAAFQTLLYRYTRQEDVVVGSPIANRNRTEVEGLIGFFVNTLVLRTDLSGNPGFLEVLHRVRKVALEAYEHQDLPFEKLVEELKPERSLSHSPLFQVMFVLQNTPSMALNLEGLSLSSVAMAGENAKFDLTLYLQEGSDGLRASLQYRTDLFNDETITRMLGHFNVLLESMVSNPTRRISELPILTAAEQHQLLVEWNGTRKEYPNDKCIHRWFEEQVEKTPEAIAVVFEDMQLTYQELNQRANQLAHYLMRLGVGPEMLVGICLERSLEVIIGVLGIMKAGGAYVPLDPEYPKDRLGFMLGDTQASILLTQERLVEKVPEHNLHAVCLDRDCEEIATESVENPNSGATAENLSYVMYTSGSTGQPKAVMIGHHNVSRLFRATESWFQFSQNDVWTMFHSYAFDFSVWEIWGALLYGGRVVVLPVWISRSPKKFYELLGREKVTVLNQTPSAFRQLIHVDQLTIEKNELALRLVILGGEALDFQSLQPWFDRYGDQCPRLVNMYGITEITVHATYRVVKSMDVSQGVGSFIGVPLPDLGLYVLDESGQLVPIGIPGELYVSGAGVGRGYLNRPELTDERFVLNPFNEKKTEKLYKTGDLVRRLANGDIEYLGRTDAQIKLRGYRIELGEIESVLGQHAAVRQAVVLAREDNPGDKRLVAYVVLRQEPAPKISDLNSFLKQKLPEYMTPSAFVFVDALPLSPNGKVDPQKLPAPDRNRAESEESYVAPRSPVEKLLAEIWAEVLKLEKVGVNNNFFELGGHSLLATQVISRIYNTFHLNLPLQSLFENPTIEGFARIIQTNEVDSSNNMAGAITPVSRQLYSRKSCF